MSKFFNIERVPVRKPRHFEPRSSRGIVYPSVGKIYERLTTGQDVSQYVMQTPFVCGTRPFQYQEFDEIMMQHTSMLQRISDNYIAEKKRLEEEAKKRKEEKERSDADE